MHHHRLVPFQDTSDETSGGKTSITISRRRRTRKVQQPSISHSKSPPTDTHQPIELDPELSALEKTQYTAERVVHSIQAVVERLALQSLPHNGGV